MTFLLPCNKRSHYSPASLIVSPKGATVSSKSPATRRYRISVSVTGFHFYPPLQFWRETSGVRGRFPRGCNALGCRFLSVARGVVDVCLQQIEPAMCLLIMRKEAVNGRERQNDWNSKLRRSLSFAFNWLWLITNWQLICF